LEEIPDEPAPGYRPELYTPRLEPHPGCLPVETWVDAQREAAMVMVDGFEAWADVEARTGASRLIDLPAGWTVTRLLLEIHELAVFVVTSPMCGGDTPDLLGELALPATLDAINGITGVDTGAVLHRIGWDQIDAARRGDWQGVERLAARMAYTAREFSRCARVFVHQTDAAPPAGEPLYMEALGSAIRAAATGQNLGDARATRLHDVLISALADLQNDREPLEGVALPLQIFRGRGSNDRSLQAHAEVIEDRVFKSIPGAYPQGAAGGALLRIALAVGTMFPPNDPGETPWVLDALQSCWDQAATDPPVRQLSDPAAHARQLALRALDALGFDVRAMLAAEGQRGKREGRATAFRAMGEVDQRRRVRTLLKSRKGSALEVSRYLGVPVEEVRAVMAEGKGTGGTARAPSKRRPG